MLSEAWDKWRDKFEERRLVTIVRPTSVCTALHLTLRIRRKRIFSCKCKLAYFSEVSRLGKAKQRYDSLDYEKSATLTKSHES
jgi:hypothetical protein